MEMYLALVLMLALAAIIGLLTMWITRKSSLTARTILAAIVVLALVCYVAIGREFVPYLLASPLLVLWIPTPFLAACLAGLEWSNGGSLRRRELMVGVISCFAITSVVMPISGSAPQCRHHWDEGICRQTTPSTCSPAAAATLLAKHDILSNEQEMAQLCLTRRGTTWGGLCRGLMAKTRGTHWRVKAEYLTLNQLDQLKSPAILKVGLQSSDQSAGSLAETGWLAGQAHSVVYLGRPTPSHVLIADPANGLETWNIHELRQWWTGEATWLEQR